MFEAILLDNQLAPKRKAVLSISCSTLFLDQQLFAALEDLTFFHLASNLCLIQSKEIALYLSLKPRDCQTIFNHFKFHFDHFIDSKLEEKVTIGMNDLKEIHASLEKLQRELIKMKLGVLDFNRAIEDYDCKKKEFQELYNGRLADEKDFESNVEEYRNLLLKIEEVGELIYDLEVEMGKKKLIQRNFPASRLPRGFNLAILILISSFYFARSYF